LGQQLTPSAKEIFRRAILGTRSKGSSAQGYWPHRKSYSGFFNYQSTSSNCRLHY